MHGFQTPPVQTFPPERCLSILGTNLAVHTKVQTPKKDHRNVNSPVLLLWSGLRVSGPWQHQAVWSLWGHQIVMGKRPPGVQEQPNHLVPILMRDQEMLLSNEIGFYFKLQTRKVTVRQATRKACSKRHMQVNKRSIQYKCLFQFNSQTVCM